jgi:hypothetical protein
MNPPEPANDATQELLVELARRKGRRAVAVLDATFADVGFSRPRDSYGGEAARQLRALHETGDFAADLATIVTAVLDHFGHVYDPAAVRAAVTCHLEARP